MVEEQEPGKTPEQFEQPLPFSESSKGVLERAKQAARMTNHDHLGTRHLLLGLIDEPSIKPLFSILPLDQDKIHSAAAGFFLIPRMLESDTSIDIEQVGFTPSVIEVIKLADREAKHYNQQEIKPEDLLTGILREGEGVAAKILKSSGLTEFDLFNFRETFGFMLK